MANKLPASMTGTSSTLSNKPSLIFSTESSDMKTLMRSNGIFDRYEMNWYKKFSRFGIIDPYNTLTKTREYLFITKPDLCILGPSGRISKVLSNNAFFVDAVRRYRPVIEQLQSSFSLSSGPFMTILSNAVTSTLDVPGISADMVETAANVMGTKISYRGTSIKSDEELDFSLEFEDTKYLDIYMLFKIYDEYERAKWDGAIDFTKAESDRWKNYILNKVLHDQVSMYKFVVADDGYRIVYWAKITGCAPTSIPREAFSNMDDSVQQKLTVGWKGHFIRDMDPTIISQFNTLVRPYVTGKSDLPLFNINTHTVNGDWASMPYIDIRTVNDQYRKENGRREYYLRWAK